MLAHTYIFTKYRKFEFMVFSVRRIVIFIVKPILRFFSRNCLNILEIGCKFFFLFLGRQILNSAFLKGSFLPAFLPNIENFNLGLFVRGVLPELPKLVETNEKTAIEGQIHQIQQPMQQSSILTHAYF